MLELTYSNSIGGKQKSLFRGNYSRVSRRSEVWSLAIPKTLDDEFITITISQNDRQACHVKNKVTHRHYSNSEMRVYCVSDMETDEPRNRSSRNEGWLGIAGGLLTKSSNNCIERHL